MTLNPILHYFQNRLAGLVLAISVVGVFAIVGAIERWGLDFDDTRREADPYAADCRLPTANCLNHHRITVDLAGCTPPSWIRVNSIVELTIKSTSDLGWTVVGCTRFAYALAKSLPSKVVLNDAKSVNRE